jgi:hypothetical protein
VRVRAGEVEHFLVRSGRASACRVTFKALDSIYFHIMIFPVRNHRQMFLTRGAGHTRWPVEVPRAASMVRYFRGTSAMATNMKLLQGLGCRGFVLRSRHAMMSSRPAACRAMWEARSALRSDCGKRVLQQLSCRIVLGRRSACAGPDYCIRFIHQGNIQLCLGSRSRVGPGGQSSGPPWP